MMIHDKYLIIHDTDSSFIIHHVTSTLPRCLVHTYTHISVSPLSPRAEYKELKKELTGVLLNDEQGNRFGGDIGFPS